MASVLRSPDPEGLRVLRLEEGEEVITVTAQTTALTAVCPCCHQPSGCIHSRYWRKLADLPCSGRQVFWHLQVRRFRCRNTSCQRKIFVERLPHVAPAYTRRWIRQRNILTQLAFALGGRPAERLVGDLGMALSHDSFIRLLRSTSLPTISSVEVVGIDDWAFRKGKAWGSILVDLEKRKVLDLLPNREKESVIAWLKEHPEIRVIRRDRGGPYAEAAREAAPQATQVADRYHLAQNLTETLERMMRQRFADIQKILTPPPLPKDEDLPLKYHDAAVEATYQKRMATYEQVLSLHQHEHNVTQIAEHLRMGRQRVRWLLKGPPERIIHKHPSPKLGPWKAHVRSRFFEDGCRNSLELYREIHALGYDGGATIVVNYVTKLRQEIGEPSTAGPVQKTQPTLLKDALATPRQIAWWFCLPQERLDDKQKQQLQQLLTSDTNLNTAYQLAQQFTRFIKHHSSVDFDQWVEKTLTCTISEFRSFARGLKRDEDAVRAGFDLPWSHDHVA